MDCTPHVYGSAIPPDIIEAVWRAKAHSPSFGTQRLANVLSHQGMVISPHTVQRLLRKEAPSAPPVPCPRRRWHALEALAPHVLWAMEICDLSTNKQDGFDRSLMTILDDHSRMVIASGLSERQTVAEVVREGRYGIGIRPCLGGKILPNRIRRIGAGVQGWMGGTAQG